MNSIIKLLIKTKLLKKTQYRDNLILNSNAIHY